jgi:hypothetical protein
MLKLTIDRKTTNSVTNSGNARIANAFSLPAGKALSCPGETSVCKSICYAGKLETYYPSFRRTVMHNWTILQDKTGKEIQSLLTDMISGFVEKSTCWGAPLDFRIHADGDFYSNDYIMAWIHTMEAFPDVRFWTYTRNYTAAVRIHKMAPNCSIYFSGDSQNVHVAKSLNKLYGIPIAGLGKTFDDAHAMFPGSVRCPENNRAVPLIDSGGSACNKCGLCMRGNRSVLFAINKPPK